MHTHITKTHVKNTKLSIQSTSPQIIRTRRNSAPKTRITTPPVIRPNVSVPSRADFKLTGLL
jgi:hypothetical protein